MLALVGLALAAATSPAPVQAAAAQPPVCRTVLQRSQLTFFHYRRREVCRSQAEWDAMEARDARNKDLNVGRDLTAR